MPTVNGMDQDALLAFKHEVADDSTRADRWPTVVAHWVGESRSRIEFNDVVTHIGGDEELNPMQYVLASFAACDVDLVAMHAAMIGLEITSLSVEASGHFNVQSFMGLDGRPGPGYDQISYKVRLDAPDATPDQIAYLREPCEQSSPVGDSLSRSIPMELEFA
ncbi:MAG: OsmC family protein [Acidimicrobiia bacterium]